jgi:hypothetical protein
MKSSSGSSTVVETTEYRVYSELRRAQVASNNPGVSYNNEDIASAFAY